MNASIGEEDDDGVGLRVRDTAGVSHGLHVSYDGEITYHGQEEYPNKAVDQDANDEIHLREAQEYAKYHVLHERGYSTLEPRHTPAWLALGLGAVAGLEPESFQDHFGEILQQYHSWIRPSINPVVEVPDVEYHRGAVVFRADVYLGLDFGEYVDDPNGVSPLEDVAELTDPTDLQRELTAHAAELADGDLVEGVSDVEALYQVQYEDGRMEEKTVGERTSEFDRPADLRLELHGPKTTLEADLPPPALREILLHHVECQVRDAHLRMGIDPPPAFRVLGQGLFEQTKVYTADSLHPHYHLTDAEIEGYRAPEEGVGHAGASVTPFGATSEGASIMRVLKETLFGE